VQEDGFELALDEMREDEPEGDGLHGREGRGGVGTEDGGGVDECAEGVGEEEGEEDGAGVFDDVDGAPGDLGA
jgi:hypothetical protein